MKSISALLVLIFSLVNDLPYSFCQTTTNFISCSQELEHSKIHTLENIAYGDSILLINSKYGSYSINFIDCRLDHYDTKKPQDSSLFSHVDLWIKSFPFGIHINPSNTSPSHLSVLDKLLSERSLISTYHYDSTILANGYHNVFGGKFEYYYNWYVNDKDSICYQILDNAIIAYSANEAHTLEDYSFIANGISSLTSRVIYCDGSDEHVIFEDAFGNLRRIKGSDSLIIVNSDYNSIEGSLKTDYTLFDNKILQITLFNDKVKIEEVYDMNSTKSIHK